MEFLLVPVTVDSGSVPMADLCCQESLVGSDQTIAKQTQRGGRESCMKTELRVRNILGIFCLSLGNYESLRFV